MKITKKIPTISALMMFIISLVAPIILATPAYAAAATETITPTAWQAAPSNVITAITPVNPPDSTTIPLVNAPGTVWNIGLNSPNTVTGSTNQLGYIPVSLNMVCPSDTPVDVTVGVYARSLTATEADPGDSFTIVSGILDIAPFSLNGAEIDSLGSPGAYASTTSQTYSTTAGNLINVGAIVNAEVITASGGGQWQASYTVGVPPEITLAYDDALCTTAPTISNASTTIVSSGTASGAVVVQGSSLNAQDADGDTLTYSITAGNGAGYFAINAANGNITTTRANVPVGTYTLTVLVDDGNGGTTTATVTITVTESGAVLAATGDNSHIYMALTSILLIGSAVVLKKRFARY